MLLAVSRDLVRKLVRTIRRGLVYGIGSGGDGYMCVQHAVARTFGEGRSDRPTCVDDDLRDIGITLNDWLWMSDEARAQGLQRFAVAQLGTSSRGYLFDRYEFKERARYFLQGLYPEHITEPMHVFTEIASRCGSPDRPASFARDAELTAIANGLADILEQMKTPGSEYLCMVDWSDEDLARPLPPEDQEAA